MRVVTPRITSGSAFRWFDRTRVETRISPPHASGFTHLAFTHTGYFTSYWIHGFNGAIFGELSEPIFSLGGVSSTIIVSEVERKI